MDKFKLYLVLKYLLDTIYQIGLVVCWDQPYLNPRPDVTFVRKGATIAADI